jgi:hypothetical protein
VGGGAGRLRLGGGFLRREWGWRRSVVAGSAAAGVAVVNPSPGWRRGMVWLGCRAVAFPEDAEAEERARAGQWAAAVGRAGFLRELKMARGRGMMRVYTPLHSSVGFCSGACQCRAGRAGGGGVLPAEHAVLLRRLFKGNLCRISGSGSTTSSELPGSTVTFRIRGTSPQLQRATPTPWAGPSRRSQISRTEAIHYPKTKVYFG